MYSEEQKI